MRRTLSLCLIALLLTAANAFAGAEARINGKVTDAATKAPIKDATVTLEATEGKTVKMNAKVKADGSYALFVLDGTLRYKLTYAAPGYTSFEETVKFKLGEPNQKNVELSKGGGAPAAGLAPAPAAVDPSVIAYNEGAELANAGKNAEAVAKFQAAIANKATFTPAWIALAKTHLKMKNYAKAIEAANKALEIDDEDTDMWSVLTQSYTATGDKAKAAEALKHMPANAAQLFNEAAALINKGKDDEAEKLLKQAVAADEKLARGYYELGMIYVRAGKSAEAKSNLSKYLELDPSGGEAATAKEMLKYLQ
jgi:tetratricopeptide (TPR) repeat protein